MVLRTLGRLILIPVAFILAAAATTFVAVTLGLEKITVAMGGREGGFETIEAYWELIAKGSISTRAAGALPHLGGAVGARRRSRWRPRR